MLCQTLADTVNRGGDMLVAKANKEERINVRIPVELKQELQKDAEISGWGISDQVRFELMYARGKWKGPHLPSRPTGQDQ